MNLAIYILIYLAGLSLLLHSLLLVSKKVAQASERVPLLDFWIAAFVWGPPIVLLFYGGFVALGVCLAIQFVYLFLYSGLHSLFYRIRFKQSGGKLLSSLGKGQGRGRVLLGFCVTLLAIPVFTVLRVGQLTVYPLLQWSVDFPAYRHGDWVQLSRHKFEGLVGLDLLWCLYCEWAAGVYALGGEMVRNNESFWCPIRFRSDKHCENCQLDFPDLKKWIPADGKIEDVQELLERQYPPRKSPRAWYGHLSRRGQS